MSYVAIHIVSIVGDRFANALKSPPCWFRSNGAGNSDGGPRHVWMLRNVSFLPRRSGEKRW